MELNVGMAPITASNIKGQSELRSVPNRCDQVVDCAGCHQVIKERYMLKAVDQLWHEDCLKCSCCDCRLGEVGSTLFTKANLILCKRDYLRLFGNTGYCSACNKMIPAFEMVMRAKTNVYHLECFACQQCNHRFCVGDKFYLCNDKILCEYDYEERLVFASMSYNYNNIAHIKKQTQNLTPAKQQMQMQMQMQIQMQQQQHQQRQNMQAHSSLSLPSMSSSTTTTMTSQIVNRNQSPVCSTINSSSTVMPHNHVLSAASLTSQSDDTSSGYGSPESPMLDRK